MKENRENFGMVKNSLKFFFVIESSTINYLINCQTCVEVAPCTMVLKNKDKKEMKYSLRRKWVMICYE